MREQRLAATWALELEAVATRIGAFVPRPESRDRLGRFMRVTVAGDTRRNGWQLAEAAAEATPHGMQRLVASAAWDVEGVRDDLRDYVMERVSVRLWQAINLVAALLLWPTMSASAQGADPNLRRLESEIGHLSAISGGKVGCRNNPSRDRPRVVRQRG